MPTSQNGLRGRGYFIAVYLKENKLVFLQKLAAFFRDKVTNSTFVYLIMVIIYRLCIILVPRKFDLGFFLISALNIQNGLGFDRQGNSCRQAAFHYPIAILRFFSREMYVDEQNELSIKMHLKTIKSSHLSIKQSLTEIYADAHICTYACTYKSGRTYLSSAVNGTYF